MVFILRACREAKGFVNVALMHADMERVERFLGGDLRAFEQLREELDPNILRTLLSKSIDGVLARDILDSIWAACVPGSAGDGDGQCLLEKYSGKAALKSYLTRAAINRYLDYLRSSEIRRRKDLGDSETPHEERLRELPGQEDAGVFDDGLAELLKKAIAFAFGECAPDGLLMWRLCARYEIKQKELAPIWGCDEATISRRMEKCMEDIKTMIQKELHRLEPGLQLDWEDVLELSRSSGGLI